MTVESLILIQETTDQLLAEFQYARRKRYRIRLERRTLFGQPMEEYWDLVIADHPVNGLVKYLLRRDGDDWVKFIGLNSLPHEEEQALLAKVQPLLQRMM
ncbi:MAG TPA: hypothetical protein VL547_19550 [Dinghuibacter sp.]|jgi:hypothetical protein|uniref:hypothetical protein n=1 Tax=Dinghuibacter sp. TaxID=2024697 RepID=UPI002B72A3C0|nr:hypothetical protein [Dinghuibacter sp.]HTJ14248.1 hypothetical protein [Dinghuibacter sp.]